MARYRSFGEWQKAQQDEQAAKKKRRKPIPVEHRRVAYLDIDTAKIPEAVDDGILEVTLFLLAYPPDIEI